MIDASVLAKHNTRESCWIAIHGNVWDITSFLDEHPGGSSLLLSVAGQDATEQYETFHDADLVGNTLPEDARRGTINVATLMKGEVKPPSQKYPRDVPPLRSMINLHDFDAIAEKSMTPAAWAYVSSGADDEVTAKGNARIYQKVFLRGRVLRKVGHVDCTSSILGCQSSMPVYTSPVGLAKLVHPSGECAIAAAAGKEGVVQVVNTVSSMPIEAIMKARVSADQPVFWQLYADKNIEKSKSFIERVENAGVKAIWLTVDSPVVGNRERDERSRPVTDAVVENSQSSGIAKANTGFINADIDWSIIDWLRAVTHLPIVVKGIQCVEDAVTAYKYGVDGIVLSNHGGRSQDTAQPPLLTLLEINHYASHILGKKMEIFVDGGIRRGTDIIKALALGATAVGVGRPVLYSMAGGYGEFGIRRMLQILRNELKTNMALIGASKITEIDRSMLNTRKLEKLMVGSSKI
ncbi:hypothetical protein M433DRAFT_63601 [Acidomyces richmondensis BFW]|nr:MAG: hypothetical protein FE78DRAFT_143126 [Acidomyces sp. 'richmondensis']KYG47206.1 hypothetical protein M433DRAFT_63601 [Acidomyces richmondensis BFW]